MKHNEKKRFPWGTVLFLLASLAVLAFGLYWLLEGMKQTPAPVLVEGLIV